MAASFSSSCEGGGDEDELEVQVPDESRAEDLEELDDSAFGEGGIGFRCYEKDGKTRSVPSVRAVALPGVLKRNIGRTGKRHAANLLKEAKKERESCDGGKGPSVDDGIGGVKGDDDSRQGEDGNDEDTSLHKRFRFDGELKLQFHSLR